MKSNSISLSQFQKRQINNAMFRRNKEYINYDQLHKQEIEYCIKRRKPYIFQKSPKCEKVNYKIQGIFKNSLTELQSKLSTEIQRFKSRIDNSSPNKLASSIDTAYDTTRISSNYDYDEQTERQRSIQRFKKSHNKSLLQINPQRSKEKIKGVPIDKLVSRDYLYRYNVERNSVVDERNFNNFYIKKNDLSKTQDLSKLSPRNIQFNHEHINDLHYETEKSYQKFYFSSKPMKTTFRLSMQKNPTDRKYFDPPKEENLPKTELDPQKIYHSFTQTNNFNRNKINSFYKLTGRELPHQLQQRQLTPNCNHYKDKLDNFIKPAVDYAVKKMYDDMMRKQKEELHKKKNPEFTRDEICDQKYFTEITKRQNKATGRTMQMRKKQLLEGRDENKNN